MNRMYRMTKYLNSSISEFFRTRSRLNTQRTPDIGENAMVTKCGLKGEICRRSAYRHEFIDERLNSMRMRFEMTDE